MQRGIQDIQALMAYMGPQWCGTAEDATSAMEHTCQAISFLLIGKDECARKASRVSLSLQFTETGAASVISCGNDKICQSQNIEFTAVCC